MSKEPEFLEATTRQILPRVLGSGWYYYPGHDDVLQNDHLGLRVIMNAMRYSDEKPWIHLSLSRRDQKIPTYEDLRTVKDLFIGRDRKAIQVFPPEAEHVNCHPGVLHLFSCLSEEDPLPDFRYKGTL